MVAPENYIGETIKMDGMFSFFHDDSSGNDYYACIIMDDTACCSQGIEFVPTDDHTYPDDFPNRAVRSMSSEYLISIKKAKTNTAPLEMPHSPERHPRVKFYISFDVMSLNLSFSCFIIADNIEFTGELI